MTQLKTRPAPAINIKGKLMTFERPKIMGILNVTPDSFYDGGQHRTIDQTLRHVEGMLEQGADIIDIGAQSSRPGAVLSSLDEELNRILPVVLAVSERFPDTVLSIDTFRATVAKVCIQAGAHIVNDISGGDIDATMLQTVADLQVPYILMHMRGLPENMHQHTQYEDVVSDVAVELGDKVATLRELGVKDIILDPGFGFAKTIEQNYELLYRVDELHYMGLPILGGISRKSMIYKKLGIPPSESLNGTIALNALLLERGVQLLRVHDVKEAKALVDLLM